MRPTIVTMLVAGVLLSTMRCGDSESLNNLQGRCAVVSMKADTSRFTAGPFPPNFAKPHPLVLAIDSIVWLNEFSASGPSSLSVIVSAADSGDFSLQLGVETAADGAVAVATVARDSVSRRFLDTVLIAVSTTPNVILPPTNSRLLVSFSGQTIDTAYPEPDYSMVFDTILCGNVPIDSLPLVNPW